MSQCITQKLKEFKQQLNTIYQEILHNDSDIETQVNFVLNLDFKNNRLTLLDDGTVQYIIDSNKGEVIDYLVVRGLQSATKGLPLMFEGVDRSILGDGYYEDDGVLIYEYWNEDVGEQVLIPTIIQDPTKQWYHNIQARNLEDRFYIYVVINRNGIGVAIDTKELLNKDLPYLEEEVIVKVLKEIISWDISQKEILNQLTVQPKPETLNEQQIGEEFLRNIHILKNHQKFHHLIKDTTVVTEDESYIYFNKPKSEAQLHRLFKGINFHANSVYDLPFTLSTGYELEDKSSKISSASQGWSGDTLNGRMQRTLHVEDDFYKFSLFLQKHFPSLKGENGGIRSVEASIRLMDEPVHQIAVTSDYNTITVYHERTRGTEILAIIKHIDDISTSHTEWGDLESNKDQLKEEYVQFIQWLTQGVSQ